MPAFSYRPASPTCRNRRWHNRPLQAFAASPFHTDTRSISAANDPDRRPIGPRPVMFVGAVGVIPPISGWECSAPADRTGPTGRRSRDRTGKWRRSGTHNDLIKIGATSFCVTQRLRVAHTTNLYSFRSPLGTNWSSLENGGGKSYSAWEC